MGSWDIRAALSSHGSVKNILPGRALFVVGSILRAMPCPMPNAQCRYRCQCKEASFPTPAEMSEPQTRSYNRDDIQSSN